MAYQDYFEKVQQLYIAFYQRPADPDGLYFWAQMLDKSGGSLEGIIDAFATSAEAISLYDTNGDGKLDGSDDMVALVTAIYQALFDRAPDAEGLAFYVTALETGQYPDGRVATPGRVALDILNGAQGVDAVIVDNKTTAAMNFTETLDPGLDGQDYQATYDGDADAAQGRAYLAQVDEKISSIPSQSETIEFIQQNVADAGDPILEVSSGQTFTLTTGLDTVPGTAGDDTINGTPSTLTLGDSIDGGDGTDTLYIGDPDSATGANFKVATIQNVENLIYQAANGNANALELSTLAGLQAVTYQDLNAKAQNVTIKTKGNATTVSVNGAATVTIEDQAAKDTLATVAIDGNSGAATITSDALTSLSLANTAQNVTVNAAAGARTLNVTVNNVTGGTITDNQATGLSVTAAGKASNGITLTAAKAASLTLAGDAALSLDGVPGTATTITSTNTAGVTIVPALGDNVSFTGGDGKDTVTVGATTKAIAMGAGDDTVHVTVALGAIGTLEGGDGTDTLAMDSMLADQLSDNKDFSKAVSGFEKLAIGAVQPGDLDSIDMANLDDISYVVSAGTAAGTGTPEIQHLTVTGTDANGGEVLVGGVRIYLKENATAEQVRDAILAQEQAIRDGNPTIDYIYSLDEDTIEIVYKNSAGNVDLIQAQDDLSGATFKDPDQVDGTHEVAEQQTIEVTAGPGTATGLFTVTVLGTDVQFTVTKGETVQQVAANMQAAIAAAGIAGVDAVTVTDDTVTIVYSASKGDVAAATFVDTGGTGTNATVTDNAVPYVPPVAETQTVQITGGSDGDGGAILVSGARIVLDPNLTVDQVGGAIVAHSDEIQAANPDIEGVAYDSATDTLTFTFTKAAGNVDPITIGDNASGAKFDVAETTQGVAGEDPGRLVLDNMADNGTLELTGDNNDWIVIYLKDDGGSANVFNLKFNGPAEIDAGKVSLPGVETINITTTDQDAKNDPLAPSEIALFAWDATKIVLSGNHGVDFTGSWLPEVVELDASGVNSTLSKDAGTAAAVIFWSNVTDQNITVKTGNGDDYVNLWSIQDATKGGNVSTGAGDDAVDGSIGADVMNLGDGNDEFWTSGKADTITLGQGKDSYVMRDTNHSTIAARDQITDFQANTVGQGPGGSVTSAGAAGNLADRNGDVIDLSWVDGGIDGVRVGVFTNAAEAQTFIQNGSLDFHNWVNAALDSTTGYLYIDVTDDGVIDSVIHLVGVTTINEAAFVV